MFLDTFGEPIMYIYCDERNKVEDALVGGSEALTTPAGLLFSELRLLDSLPRTS